MLEMGKGSTFLHNISEESLYAVCLLGRHEFEGSMTEDLFGFVPQDFVKTVGNKGILSFFVHLPHILSGGFGNVPETFFALGKELLRLFPVRNIPGNADNFFNFIGPGMVYRLAGGFEPDKGIELMAYPVPHRAGNISMAAHGGMGTADYRQIFRMVEDIGIFTYKFFRFIPQ